MFWRWLKGIDEICAYTHCGLSQIMDAIRCLDFPAERQNEIWIAKRSKLRKWLRKYAKEITEEDIPPPVQSKLKIIGKRW